MATTLLTEEQKDGIHEIIDSYTFSNKEELTNLIGDISSYLKSENVEFLEIKEPSFSTTDSLIQIFYERDSGDVSVVDITILNTNYNLKDK